MNQNTQVVLRIFRHKKANINLNIMNVFELPNKGIKSYVLLNYMNPILSKVKRKLKAKEDFIIDDLPKIDPKESVRTYQHVNSSDYKGPITWQLIKLVGLYYYIVTPMSIFTTFISFVTPFLNTKLIKGLEESDPDSSNYKFLLAFALFAYSIFEHYIGRLSSDLYSMSTRKLDHFLYSLIINKTLKLPPTEIEKLGQGKLLYLFNTRAMITFYILNVNNNLLSILSTIVSLILVIYEVGFIFIASLGFSLLSLGIGKLIRKRLDELSKRSVNYFSSRNNLMLEIIKGIKAIKTNSLEEHALARCNKEAQRRQVNSTESSILQGLYGGQKLLFHHLFILSGLLFVLWNDKNEFTLSKIYAVTYLYNSMSFPLQSILSMWQGNEYTKATFNEFEEFLNLPEREVPVMAEEEPNGTIKFEGAQVACIEKEGSEPRIFFEDTNLRIDAGEFVGIVGPIGSGKSLFLKGIINECMIPKGRIYAKGRIMYLPHEAWIINQTLRNNIVLDQEFDQDKYDEIIDLCQLREDIMLLPKGDETLIGSRGVNLSGGQRQRVALARALYCNGDIFLFDDSLCQLDPVVAANIFHDAFKGYLKNKTKVFVTSNISWVSEISRVIILDNGKITADGTYEQLHKTNSFFMNFKGTSILREEKEDKKIEKPQQSVEKKNTKEEEEGKVDRRMDWKLLKELFSYSSIWYLPLLIICTFLITWLRNLNARWPYLWSADTMKKSTTFYAIGYIVVVLINHVFNILYENISVKFENDLESKVRETMFKRILNAPLHWHDVIESGVIIKKATEDTFSAFLIVSLMESIFNQISAFLFMFLFAVSYIPELGLVTIASGILTVYFARTRHTISLFSRQLTEKYQGRFTTQFQEFLDGLIVIRSRGTSTINWMKSCMFEKSDNELRLDTFQSDSYNWENIRSQAFGNLVKFYVYIMLILKQDLISPAIAVILINESESCISSLTGIISTIRNFYEILETCRRLFTFMQEIPQEKNIDAPAPDQWPKSNNISVKKLSLRYRENLPYIIKDLNLEIIANEKVGIAGRTGSGKSTLLLGLVRLLEPSESNKPSIEIGGEDIVKIGLRSLRKKVVMIPQEPWLLSGKVRHNMDPEDKWKDEEILDLFNRIGLKSALEKKLEKPEDSVLDIKLLENGGNLSQGEKQLLCIARALIKKPNVLLMDEATANLDEVSDQALLRYMQEEMKNTTVVIVAHRRSSLSLCNRIIDLSN